MNKIYKLLLMVLTLSTVLTPIKCTECDHVCSENCIYDESGICLHDCNIDPLVKFEPWG